jgi:replicative DNA helicase
MKEFIGKSSRSWVENWVGAFLEESVERFDLKTDSLCKYGINCLDDALGGIYKNDLIVIGADSGCGKSELVLNIAKHNAALGKKVVLYYLEGGHVEAMRRMKWRDTVEEYYENHHGAVRLDLDYSRWVSNSITDSTGTLKKIEEKVLDKYHRVYGNNLKICQISEDFSIQDFLSSIVDFFQPTISPSGMLHSKLDADLILIDHLQYFSLPEGENELASITKIIRQCKHITDRYKIPIVLVSHLRKKTKDRGLPDQEDFYGSSNIPKIATTAIVISPDYEGEDRGRDRYPTFFRIVKSRTGIRPNLAIRGVFNLKFRAYEPDYSLYKIDSTGHVPTDCIKDNEKPSWAVKKQPQKEIQWCG